MAVEDDALPLPFGISAATGRPVTTYTVQDLPEPRARRPRRKGDKRKLAPLFKFNADKLDEVGWGLIFPSTLDPAPYLDALSVLLQQRRIEAGGDWIPGDPPTGGRFRIFSEAEGCKPGESAEAWLQRHGVALNPIMDPRKGVPYYLVLVGSPREISFSFQYTLDIGAAVGRLDFPNLDELRQYAQHVVDHEKPDSAERTRRELAIFATAHSFDPATQLFTKKVAQPLASGISGQRAFAEEFGFKVSTVFGKEASKEGLKKILQNTADGPPSILFTGTHGMAFGHDDSRLADNQGALVCADWPGYGNIDASHWFGASDVNEDTTVRGLIHFFFACYGAGTPEFDDFNRLGEARRIAPLPMTARLPQTLLARGALASLGHVDRAWASSFQTGRGVAQTQGFEDVMGRLMSGQRVGQATDMFNMQWGTLSTQLAETLNLRAAGAKVNESALLALWIARDDARNYVVLGDPAVKLRPQPVVENET